MSGVLIFDSAAYSVVVLPEPVGPVTSKMPCGRLIISTIVSRWSAPNPKSARSSSTELFVEQTHRNAFTKCGRHRRDTHVDVFARDLASDATVLRQPLFRDVQPCHDLDASDDRVDERARRFLYSFQDVVDAIAHHHVPAAQSGYRKP